jgi:hypothetical protein
MRPWMVSMLLGSILITIFIETVVRPQSYKEGYASGYQSRIDYEHGK